MELSDVLSNRIGVILFVIIDNLSNEDKLIGMRLLLFETINGVHNVTKLVGLFIVGLLLLGGTHIAISFRDNGNKQVKENDNVEDDAHHEDKEVYVVVFI